MTRVHQPANLSSLGTVLSTALYYCSLLVTYKQIHHFLVFLADIHASYMVLFLHDNQGYPRWIWRSKLVGVP